MVSKCASRQVNVPWTLIATKEKHALLLILTSSEIAFENSKIFSIPGTY
jgi:hypothetical protein